MTAAPAVLAAAALALGGAQPAAAPITASRDGQVRIAVTGIQAAAASVKLAGGLAGRGRWFNWVALRRSGPGSWWTILRAPGFYGVYPVQVRAGGRVTDTGRVVAVLPRGFAGRPGFEQPEQVAQWWARVSPPGATVTSVSTWHTGFYTHRVPTLNRLLLVHVTLHGPWRPVFPKAGPNEIFLSIGRLTPTGLWRLLETATSP